MIMSEDRSTAAAERPDIPESVPAVERRTVATTPDSDSSLYERGAAMMREVYAGDVQVQPEGKFVFSDVMMKTLMAGVWSRDVLSIRDRRLLVMGAIAAFGAAEPWVIQARAALERGELTPDELRETLVMLAPYAGYPNVSRLTIACEQLVSEWLEAKRGD